MKDTGKKTPSLLDTRGFAETQFLVLPDGRVLVHNLTPAMAQVLHKLDPQNLALQERALLRAAPKNPLR
jgi:hypothetical protein